MQWEDPTGKIQEGDPTRWLLGDFYWKIIVLKTPCDAGLRYVFSVGDTSFGPSEY